MGGGNFWVFHLPRPGNCTLRHEETCLGFSVEQEEEDQEEEEEEEEEESGQHRK